MQDIRLIDADPTDGVTWELDVDEYWVNMNGSCLSIYLLVPTISLYMYMESVLLILSYEG
jgi:hypothetical protein